MIEGKCKVCSRPPCITLQFDGEWMSVCRSCNEWLTEMTMRATHEEVVYTALAVNVFDFVMTELEVSCIPSKQ